MYKEKQIPRVLIVIDNAKREQLGAFLLQTELEKIGAKVKLTSRYVIAEAFNSFKPHFVVLPKIHKIQSLEEISKRAYIGLLSAESYSGSQVCTVMSHATFQQEVDLVDLRFCWGAFDRDLLISEKIIKPSKVVITGHPMTDFWYISETKVSARSKKRIGIASTLKVLANAVNQRNMIELIDGIENNRDAQGCSNYFDAPNHSECWFAFEVAFIRLMINIADYFTDYEISIRPHPLERPEDYMCLTKTRVNLEIDTASTLVEWLDSIDVMLSFISSSQIDAFARGKRVISLRGLFPEEIIKNLPKGLMLTIDNLFEEPKTLSELESVLKEQSVSKIEETNSYLKAVYDFPSTSRPSVKIAESIVNFLSVRPSKIFTAIPITGRTRKLIGLLPGSSDIIMLALSIKSRLGWTNLCFSHSYCLHKIHRNRRLSEVASRISAY